ncbi:MAG TPA: pyridoxamine 5'-phosphate oxidase family protein [Chloroflexota bacterium]
MLERPFNATLATYRRDGTVLLSPVWHEWRDGGFNIATGADDVKARHIERQKRAVAVVSDNEFRFRGIELSCEPTLVRDPEIGRQTMGRIARRYLGERRSAQYLTQLGDGLIVIRMMPGVLRTWDFADDAELFGGSAG